MTRANAEQNRHNPWFPKAGAACSIVRIARFGGPNTFALKVKDDTADSPPQKRDTQCR